MNITLDAKGNSITSKTPVEDLFQPDDVQLETLTEVARLLGFTDPIPISQLMRLITVTFAIKNEANADTRHFLIFNDKTEQEFFLSSSPTAEEYAFIISLINYDRYKYILNCQRCGREVVPQKGEGIARRVCGICRGRFI